MSLKNFFEQRKLKEQELKEKYGEDFGKTTRTIEINKAEEAIINEWRESLKPEIVKIRGRNWDCSGELTYCFTATGLGYVLTVKESVTGKELNVTQALEWYFFG